MTIIIDRLSDLRRQGQVGQVVRFKVSGFIRSLAANSKNIASFTLSQDLPAPCPNPEQANQAAPRPS